MTVIETICIGIRERRSLAFLYKDERRTADPYILGYSGKNALVLSAVQRTGGSGRGFRSFPVDGLSDLTVTETRFFGTHPDYNPRDAYFERILCQV